MLGIQVLLLVKGFLHLSYPKEFITFRKDWKGIYSEGFVNKRKAYLES